MKHIHRVDRRSVVGTLALARRAEQAPAPTGRGRIGGIGIGAYPQRNEDQAAVERGRCNLQR